MENRISPALFGSTAALLAGFLLAGCAAGTAGTAAHPAASTAQTAAVVGKSAEQVAASATEAKQAVESAADRPGRAEGELIVVTAKVKAINKKKRIVTLRYPDGKEVEVECGPEVRNFAQIRVGDDVRAEFLETAELFVAAPQAQPTADTAKVMERAPLGSKPGVVAVNTVEVAATVDAIDYTTRQVKLRGPEGKTVTVKAGPEVTRLNEIKKGDTVVARLTKAVSIQVSAPK